MNENQTYAWSLQDYVKIVKRRKFWMLLPFLTILGSALMLALMLPATYESKAVILIEEQEVPRDFVRSTITSYASQRVQVVSQRVLTASNIRDILQKYQGYGQQGSEMGPPSLELVEEFRGNVNLELISADVVDPRSGRPSQATIAFTLSFVDPDPATAEKVASELVTLFLNENKRDRAEQATSTEEFLAAQAESLNNELLELEQHLADFKSTNEGSLPEQYMFNLQMLERSQREMSSIKLRMQELAKRKIELNAKMAPLSRSAPVVLPSGDVVLSDVDRLKALQTEYRRKASIYRENHPDVVRLGREIGALQAELGLGPDIEDLRRQLREQQQLLADLQSRYKDSHGEVQSTRRVIEQLETSIRTASPKKSNLSGPAADNPAYVMLQTELETMAAEVVSLDAREEELSQEIGVYEVMLKRAPEVEQGYQALLRDYQNATTEYKSVKANQRDAMTSRNLEQEQKGQRFTLVEPPALPLDPVSPNRPAIIFLGLLLAAGAGIGSGIVREAVDGAIHGPSQLTALMGAPPLAVVPYIENDQDLLERRRMGILSFALITACVPLLYLFQYFFIGT